MRALLEASQIKRRKNGNDTMASSSVRTLKTPSPKHPVGVFPFPQSVTRSGKVRRSLDPVFAGSSIQNEPLAGVSHVVIFEDGVESDLAEDLFWFISMEGVTKQPTFLNVDHAMNPAQRNMSISLEGKVNTISGKLFCRLETGKFMIFLLKKRLINS